ncbi:MAG: 4-hydroxy-tetrahydrodipicolinate reductase [Firmicutes bacterium]|nr:4-hydroxy-tetrahydrodipicolinate reductase [Bacillota bacterium]
MTGIILHGCFGRMGKAITRIASDYPEIKIVAGIDTAQGEADYPVFAKLSDCDVAADVIVDFSVAAAVPALLEGAKAKKLPLVLCSTGLSEEDNAKAKELSNEIPLLRSANMSLGINLLVELVKQAASVLYKNDFDIEMLERHHNKKADAPSGTALMIADSLNEALSGELKYIYDRSSVRGERAHNELGISAIRGGSIPGDHDVIFAGDNEIFTISHNALSRDIFAKGALAAAKFLKDKPAGFYTMKDVILADK